MKILMINSVCGIRSTGRICTDIAKRYLAEGHEVRIAYGRETVPQEYQSIAVPICTKIDTYMNALKARLFDNEGFNAKRSTKVFLKWAQAYDPDVLWLHNLHGYYINVELLFDWIKSRPHMEVKWTLHDCWAFTGHCPYFTVANCDKWKTVCGDCPQVRCYPGSLGRDRSKENFLQKKAAFIGVSKMTLITPSRWLADLIGQSYLQEYPVDVIYNTIDTDVFRPTESDFREKNGLQNQRVILGVAAIWDTRKGLQDFVKLRQMLDASYTIVLVGLSEKQASKLPGGILCIPRTNSKQELAEIYTAADVFVNPSKEETFGLTTLEAISCGTPTIVYKNTACEEVINHYGNGIAIDSSVLLLVDTIKKIVV